MGDIAAGKVKAAHEIGVGLDNTELDSLGLGYRADRTDQLVLNRNAKFEERNRNLRQARSNRRTEDDLLIFDRTLLADSDKLRNDAILLLRPRSIFTENFDAVVDLNLHLHATAASDGFELFQ